MKRIINIIIFSILPAVVIAADKYDPYISLLGYKLEKSNLIEIKKALGEAPINRSGDAGGSYYGVCYLLPRHNITVYFESGEMGGNDHDLLSFVVKETKEEKLKCGVLPDIKPSALKVGVLSLGKDANSVKGKLPGPVKKTKHGFEHKNFGKRQFTEEDIKMNQVDDMKYAFWDVFTAIEVFTHNGKITGYKVYRVTSW